MKKALFRVNVRLSHFIVCTSCFSFWFSMIMMPGVPTNNYDEVQPHSDTDSNRILILPSSKPDHIPPIRVFLTAYFEGREKWKLEAAKMVSNCQAIANATGLFDKIFPYHEFPRWILDDSTWAQHLTFLQRNKKKSRGAGYWFWKPVLIDHHLSDMEWNEFLLFSAVDRFQHFSWSHLLVKTMLERGANLALYQAEPYLDRYYVKRDTYVKFCKGRDQETDQDRTLGAGVILIRKTPGIIQLVKRWKDAVKDIHLLSDEPSELPNIPGFKGHRHDQSILNVLVRCVYNSSGKTIFERGRIDPSNTMDSNKHEVVTYTFRIPELGHD
jgi:hypothetical protein